MMEPVGSFFEADIIGSRFVSFAVGSKVGLRVGGLVGCFDGFGVGLRVGGLLGCFDGFGVGGGVGGGGTRLLAVAIAPDSQYCVVQLGAKKHPSLSAQKRDENPPGQGLLCKHCFVICENVTPQKKSFPCGF